MSSPSTTQSLAFKSEAHRQAVMTTLASMNQTISVADLTLVSNRSITEVEALKQEIAAVVPAGNIVGLVMSGLLRLRGRSLPVEQAKSDVSALLRGLEVLPDHILSKAIYGTFVAGPAAVLSAYQKLLTLTGKNLDSAFPEGLWQFYLEFALREDSARHANETVGFQKALVDYKLDLSEADQLAAWVCAVSRICFQYDDLLYNEWREQTILNLLESAAEAANLSHKLHFQRLARAWAAQRPYRRGQDVKADEIYVDYRRRHFDNFFQSRLEVLPISEQHKFKTAYAEYLKDELAAYQQQMTILATLDPERYRENRSPVPLWQARIGLIFKGRYYLLPLCQTDQAGRLLLFETKQSDAPCGLLMFDAHGDLCDQAGRLYWVDRQGQVYDQESHHFQGCLHPIHFQAARRLVAAILDRTGWPDPDRGRSLDEQLLAIRRSDQERARNALKYSPTRQVLQALKCAPVIINWDEQETAQPLAYIRQGRRGVGDHALTIFRTSDSMVFDQSHIFFDGVWGIALSEIMTCEAISWAAYFSRLDAPPPARRAPEPLQLDYTGALEKFPQMIWPEVSVESCQINTKNLYKLLKLLPKRQPNLKLTVNDILVLYRCEFCHEYKPSAAIDKILSELRAGKNAEAQVISELLGDVLLKFQTGNPSLMIPMNATAAKPRVRLYPTTFRSPFTELWTNYKKALDNLNRYSGSQTADRWQMFNGSRRSLLVQLDYFGQLMRAYKKVALAGGSPSTATMKLLAHVPHALVKLLQEIPQRVHILNEVIKGEESFSNVGRVARGSSLSRFISAKDDHENKALVWAVLTDDTDTLHLSLRDFRPYVATLRDFGRIDLAEMVVTDYLNAFTMGFNQFVVSLLDILNAQARHASGGESLDEK